VSTAREYREERQRGREKFPGTERMLEGEKKTVMGRREALDFY
jgi:hypothetical protein